MAMQLSNHFCGEVLPAALSLREIARLIFSSFILDPMTPPPATLLLHVLLVPKASLTVCPSKAEARLAPSWHPQPSFIPVVLGQGQGPRQGKEGTGAHAAPCRAGTCKWKYVGREGEKDADIMIKVFIGFLMGLKEKKIVAEGEEGGDGGNVLVLFYQKRW